MIHNTFFFFKKLLLLVSSKLLKILKDIISLHTALQNNPSANIADCGCINLGAAGRHRLCWFLKFSSVLKVQISF